MSSFLIKRMIAVLLIICVVAVSGCAGGESKSDKESNKMTEQEIIAEMKDYFFKRYGNVSVTVEGFIQAGWDGPEDRLNLSSDIEGRRETFHVLRTPTENEEYIYSDNYLGLLLRSQFEQLVSESAKPFFAENKSFVSISQEFGKEYSAESTVEELIEKDAFSYVDILVFVSEKNVKKDEFQVLAEKMADAWEQKGISSYLRILLVEATIYDNLNRDDSFSSWIDRCIADYRRTSK